MENVIGFAPLALSAGYLTKEIFSLRLDGTRLTCSHGTAGDGDDRQMGPAVVTRRAFSRHRSGQFYGYHQGVFRYRL